VDDFNGQVIKEFRANSGKVGGYFEGKDLVVLTTTGAKSGEPRVHPLVYFTDGDQRYIIASKGGAPTHPAWYFNLKAHPVATAEYPSGTVRVNAREVTGAERDRLYANAVSVIPGFGDYEKATTRVIPVFYLDPVS
jgi:deazaflavin-dependent oxidoreductase (nitroreductase family)